MRAMQIAYIAIVVLVVLMGPIPMIYADSRELLEGASAEIQELRKDDAEYIKVEEGVPEESKLDKAIARAKEYDRAGEERGW